MATARDEPAPSIDWHAANDHATASISDARYRAIVEDQTDLVCRFLPDTTLTYVNPAYCRQFGRSFDELIGRRFLEMLPDELHAKVRAHLGSITADHPVATHEHEVNNPDGSRGWQQWINRALFSPDGAIVEFQAVGRDITARRAAEEELRGYRTRLEELVQQRTADLARANDALQRELAERQHAEHDLRESEERFRQLAESVSEAFWVLDPDSRRMLYLSPAFEQLWGRSRADLECEPGSWLAAVHPDDRARVAAAIEEQCRGLRTDQEFRVVQRDGGVHQVRNRGFPVLDANGRLRRVVGIAEDIAERRRAEDVLRAANDFLDNIINCIADPIFVKNRKHELVLVNDALCAMICRRREELLGRTDYDFFPREQSDVFWEKDEVVFETGNENINEEEITDANGRTRTIVTRKTAYTDRDGHRLIVGIIRDVTERKQAEIELLRIRKAVESTRDAIGIADLNLCHVYQNQALYDLLGYTVEELNAQGGPQAVFVDHELARQCFTTIRLGGSWQGEAELRTARGMIVPVLVRADAIKDAEERVVALVGIMTDITEHKHAQEAERRHQEEMTHAARLSTVGEMASGLAHELAQPLSAILYFARGCLTQLENRRWGAKEAASAVTKIAAQAERAGEFIHRLKAFVRKAQPQRTPVDLNSIVREALALLAPQIRSTRTAVQLDLAEAMRPVLADSIQIEQVILNLVRNGIEAMEPLPQAGRRLHVRTWADADRTTSFEVRDTGPGLDSGVAAQVFDPFFTTKPNGTGLGLPISRTLIEEVYAGRLWIEPHPESGVRAGFSLPPPPEDESDGS